MTLRENQVDPVKKGIDFFNSRKPKPSLIVAPTAFGKSIVISKIANEIEDKIIVLQPSKELLEQNYAKLKLMGGSASIYSASMGIKEIGHITYATIGSIKSIGHVFKEQGFTKMIIDEADRYPRSGEGMLGKFITSSGISHVLGLTATPLKLQTNSFNMESYSILKMLTSRSKHGNFFKEIIHVCQISEMVDLGFWSPLEYEVYDFDTGALVFNSTKAEYTEESVKKAYDQQAIELKIINTIRQSDRKSILVFVPSVDQAISLAAKIPNCAAVWGDMDKKERADVLERFKCLDLRVVINVNVLSIGFDHPELDMIVSGRATASLSWWYQAVGRITRIHPNKKNGLIVDFSGNTVKFGKVEDLYYKKEGAIWKLYGHNGLLLTGIPIDQIGEHTEKSEARKWEEKNPKRVEGQSIKINFGKHTGKMLTEVPASYRDWMLENLTFTSKNAELERELKRLRN